MSLQTTSPGNIGNKVTDFKLKNIDGNFLTYKDIRGKRGTLIFFICNHCPYVKAIIEKLVIVTKKLEEIDVKSVAIMPNDTLKYPEDGFDKMVSFALSNNFNFPYLYDESQDIARAFGAVCTPDFFGYNWIDELQYRGRFAQLNNLQYVNDTIDLLDAMTQVSKTSYGPVKQFPSAGCSIKWK